MEEKQVDPEGADGRPADDAWKRESGATMVIGFYLCVGLVMLVVLVVGLLIFLSQCAADFKNL
jgi:hypothetical protein